MSLIITISNGLERRKVLLSHVIQDTTPNIHDLISPTKPRLFIIL